MGAAVVPIALTLSAAATGAQIHQSRKARKEAERTSREQAARQQSLEAEREDRESQLRDKASQRIRRARLRAQGEVSDRGRGGTILTTPLGISGDSSNQGQRKSLLGQ